MTDNQLYALFIELLDAGLALQGLTATTQQAFQPTTQGTPTPAAVFISKVSDNRYGFPSRKYAFNEQTQQMIATETEKYETTFKLTALAPQDPTNTSLPTPADVLKAASWTLQNDATVIALQAAGVGIYRIQALDTSYIMDEKGQFEAAPFVKFTVTHSDTQTSVIPSTGTVTGIVDVIQ